MSLFTDALRTFWLPDIQNVQADIGLTIGSWLKETNYYVHSVTSSDEFVLEFSSIEDALSLFMASANRNFSGCFESIASISEVERSPRSIAWMLIKLYYAAFFAAHGQMRACGYSCAHLDALDASRIFDTANLYGLVGSLNKFKSGQYLIVFDPVSLRMSFKACSSGSGSHETLWQNYLMFLDHIRALIPAQIAIAQQGAVVDRRIYELKLILCQKGLNGGNWLSNFRNTVQYRHSHGVWYPYTISRSVSKRLVEKAQGLFLSDPESINLIVDNSSTNKEIDSFYSGTLTISSIARSTVLELSARSNNPKSIANRGAVSFLKICKLSEAKRS